MASAAPLLGQMFVGQMISKIGRDQGWNPMVTAGLGILGGAGVGSAISGGMSAASAAGAGSVNAGISQGGSIFGAAGSTPSIMAPVSGVSSWGVPNSALTLGPRATVSGGLGGSLFPNGTNAATATLGGVSQASPLLESSFGSMAAAGTKEAWKALWNDKEFATAMGSQFIDAAFAEEPPVQHQATGGGGGGGSSPLGSPYQGGNGVSGQYKLTSGMPGRAQGIQWKGI